MLHPYWTYSSSFFFLNTPKYFFFMAFALAIPSACNTSVPDVHMVYPICRSGLTLLWWSSLTIWIWYSHTPYPTATFYVNPGIHHYLKLSCPFIYLIACMISLLTPANVLASWMCMPLVLIIILLLVPGTVPETYWMLRVYLLNELWRPLNAMEYGVHDADSNLSQSLTLWTSLGKLLNIFESHFLDMYNGDSNPYSVELLWGSAIMQKKYLT